VVVAAPLVLLHLHHHSPVFVTVEQKQARMVSSARWKVEGERKVAGFAVLGKHLGVVEEEAREGVELRTLSQDEMEELAVVGRDALTRRERVAAAVVAEEECA
jgi:hypothetical protein